MPGGVKSAPGIQVAVRRPEFLDIALVYALINFIATIAVTKYVKFSHLGHPSGEDERGDV